MFEFSVRSIILKRGSGRAGPIDESGFNNEYSRSLIED
jgi:hypothetical protein